MNEFQPLPANDHAFDEREQAEIIALAAALQREHGQRATLSELERAATEIGIEPRFVREAVQRRRQGIATPVVIASSTEPIGAPWQAPLVAALFVPVQIFVFRSAVMNNESGHIGALLVMVIGVAVLFGLSLPRRPSARRIAAFWPAIVMFLIMLLNHGAWWFPWWHRVWLTVLWLAAVQGAVAVAAHVFRTRKLDEPEFARP